MALREDGTVIRLPMKPRGRTLTEHEIREWRDVLAAFLAVHGKLSVPDVVAVLESRIGERQVRNRLEQMKPVIEQNGLVGVMGELIRKRDQKYAG